MPLLTRKSLWLNCIALCLLLSCGQSGTIINPESTITPQKGTITQEGESLHISLHQAVLQGDIETVRALLPTIYINTPDDQGNTALHLAVLQDNLDIVKILVEAKADIHAKNTAGLSPLELASQKGNPQIIEALAAVASRVAIQEGETTGKQMSLVQLLFHWDYENIGKKRILAYIPMKDKGQLRGTCVEMGWKLFEKDALNVSLTSERLQDMRLGDYPRLYPHVQHANYITFQPVPADAIVPHAGDLQPILKDSRFTVKSIVFKGERKYLEGVRAALPGYLKESLLLLESLAAAHSAEVISGLITALKKDKNSFFGRDAADALKGFKASIPDIISGLLACLQDQDSNVRSSAAYALGKLKSSTPKVISGLLTALKDQDYDVRKSAAYALVKIGTPEAIRGLLTALKDQDSNVRSSAAYALGKLNSSTPEVIRGLLTALKGEDVNIRMSAAAALGELKASTPDVISGLLTALKDYSSDVRRNAVNSLCKLKASTPEVISGVLTALKNQGKDVRSSAAAALGELKSSTPEVIRGLLTALKNQGKDVRSSAAYALGKLKPSTPEVIRGLLTALKDQDYFVRRHAAKALEAIKASVPDVIRGLLTALKDQDTYVRSSAASALGELKASIPEVISGLLTALKDKYPDVRSSAAKALKDLKANTPEVTRGLLIALKDQNSFVRSRAASALGELKASTPDIISGLLTALKDQHLFSLARISAADALVKLKASTPEVISGLLKALQQDQESDVRSRAASALKEIKASTPLVISGLLKALQQDQDSSVRSSAADALGEIGVNNPKTDVQVIIGGLFSTFQNKRENADVRNGVADALDKMRDHLLPEQLEQLGNYYYDHLDYEKAAGNYSKLLELTHKGSESYAVLVARTIESYLKSEEQDNLYKARGYFAEAETLFNKLERKHLLNEQTHLLFIDLLTNIGSFYFKISSYPVAEEYFNLAREKLKTASKGQEKVEYLNLLHKQGLLALAKGHTSEAIQKFESAQNCYEKLEKPEKGFTMAYIGISEGMIMSYIELNELDKAYVLCEKVTEIICSLGGESLASFDRSIKMLINTLRLQLEAAETPERKESVGLWLKGLLYNPGEAQKDVPGLKEVVERLKQFKPEVIQVLIDCYSGINIKEADKWVKESNIKEKGELNKLEPNEEYYAQTTLLNLMATHKTVKNGTIDVYISSHGEKALCKELWDNLNESERREIRYNPKLENLDLASLTTKPQEAIRDLIQDNITQAVQYVYAQAKEGKAVAVRPLIEEVVRTLSKGIIKTEFDNVEKQNLMRKKDSKNYPYSKAKDLDVIFTDFCDEFQKRIDDLPKEGSERIDWAKRTCAWIEYRINLTDYFYGEENAGKVAGVLVAFVCKLADCKMPVFLDREDYFKGAPNTVREENSEKDQASLQFAEWEHYYTQRFPGEEHHFGMYIERLEQLLYNIYNIKNRLSDNVIVSDDREMLEQLPANLLDQVKNLCALEYLMQSNKLDSDQLSLYREVRSELPKEIEGLCQDVRIVLEMLPKKAAKPQASEVSKDPINDRLLKKIQELPEKIAKLSTPEAAKPVEYYVAEANQNLERISKLVGTGTLSTTLYASKRAAIKEYDKDLLSSKIEADFTQEIKRLYNQKDRPFEDEKALASFVKVVAYNLLKSNIKIEKERKDTDIFREEEKGTEKWRIGNDFNSFIKELHELLPKVKEGKVSVKYLGALIHYRVSMTGRFFKDGNRRIALALETFVMMRNRHELPGFYNEADWKIAAPITFKNEESLAYVNDLTEDARFLKWYYKYSQLFGAEKEWNPKVEKIEPKDPWSVMAQGALTRALESEHTIYDAKNIFQIPGVLRAYVQKTGIEVKKMVVFKPERVLLHEVIAAVVTRVALPDGDEEGVTLGKIVGQVVNSVEGKEAFQTFAGEIDERYESFKEIISRRIKRSVTSGVKDDQYAKLINKYTNLLGHYYEVSKKRMRVEEEQKVLADLVAWELLKREYQADIEAMVSQEMMVLEKGKDEIESKVIDALRSRYIASKENEALRRKYTMNFLTTHTGSDRAIWVLAGGPASGKTSIFRKEVKGKLLFEEKDNNNIDACNINPDIFKPLLLKLGEDYHAARTHEESSHVKDLVLKKLEYMLDKTEKGPSMVLDVVNPDLKKFETILKGNPKINLYTTTCPVTDEVMNKVEVIDEVEVIKEVKIPGSITRAFYRASKEFDDKGGKNPDYGRYVPSHIVLDGHKKVSECFPGFIKSGRYSIIELYDNTTRESKKVCHLKGKALEIDNFSRFIEFLKKRHINTKAYSAETVYGKKYVDSSTRRLKPEHVASSLAEYLKSGIIINYKHNTHWDQGLISNNIGQSLRDFTGDLSGDLVKDLDKNKESSQKEAKALFEALVLDILNRSSLKGAFPVHLQEGEGKELSIFSNEIENEDYLDKGSVFRFLRAIVSIILKEKGTQLSSSMLDKISRDVLRMVIAKELPRGEEKLIKYLPQLIESAIYAANTKT
jgi:HEAT repeat protein